MISIDVLVVMSGGTSAKRRGLGDENEMEKEAEVGSMGYMVQLKVIKSRNGRYTRRKAERVRRILRRQMFGILGEELSYATFKQKK